MQRDLRRKITIDPWHALAIAGALAGLAIRSYIVLITKTPGTSDPAFYYTVAKNIAEGRGLLIDYVMYYFNGLVPITHYSNSYWLPLASIFLSLPMMIFGRTVNAALVASMIAGVVPCSIAYLATFHLYKSKPLAILAGIVTFFSPIQITTSVVTDSIVFFGALGATALFLASLGRNNSRYFLIAAICTGLANMTRQDGILLLATLLCMILIIGRISIKEKALLVLAVTAIHLTVISPLLLRNYVETGSVASSGTAKTLFLAKYEDMYSYGKSFSWKALRAEFGIKKIIQRKLYIAQFNLEQFAKFLDPILTILLLAGLIDLIRLRNWKVVSSIVPALVFVSLGYLLYSFVWSIHGPGSFYKSLSVLMPFISIVIISLLAQHFRSLRLAAILVIGLAAYSGYQGFRQAYQFASYYNIVYQDYAKLEAIVTKDALQRGNTPQDIIVAAREPWDVNAATGFKSIMIPNNDLETIIDISNHYGAQYLLLPAPRNALSRIYDGTIADPRLDYFASVPNTDWKIYHITSAQPDSGNNGIIGQ